MWGLFGSFSNPSYELFSVSLSTSASVHQARDLCDHGTISLPITSCQAWTSVSQNQARWLSPEPCPRERQRKPSFPMVSLAWYWYQPRKGGGGWRRKGRERKGVRGREREGKVKAKGRESEGKRKGKGVLITVLCLWLLTSYPLPVWIVRISLGMRLNCKPSHSEPSHF